MDECDFEGYKIFYHYLPRLKLQFNRDFKQYVTEAVKPINNNELGKWLIPPTQNTNNLTYSFKFQ